MPELATAEQALKSLSQSVDPEELADMDAVVLFDLSGEGGGQWTATIADGQFSVNEGKTADPTVTLGASIEDMVALVRGDLNPMTAFMQGRIKVDGDMSMAMKLQTLFG